LSALRTRPDCGENVTNPPPSLGIIALAPLAARREDRNE